MFFIKKELKILAPVSGELTGLDKVPVSGFGLGALGKGVAIIPSGNEIYSPVTGLVTSLFPTFHAIGLTTKEGIEILIHIGINTVNLGGVNFEAKVKDKAGVRAGTLLLRADMDKIRRAGYDTITPVVVCNPKECGEITCMPLGKINKGDVIMEIKL